MGSFRTINVALPVRSLTGGEAVRRLGDDVEDHRRTASVQHAAGVSFCEGACFVELDVSLVSLSFNWVLSGNDLSEGNISRTRLSFNFGLQW